MTSLVETRVELPMRTSAIICASPCVATGVASPFEATCSTDVLVLRHRTSVAVDPLLTVPSARRRLTENCAGWPGATDEGPTISSVFTAGADGALGFLLTG